MTFEEEVEKIADALLTERGLNRKQFSHSCGRTNSWYTDCLRRAGHHSIVLLACEQYPEFQHLREEALKRAKDAIASRPKPRIIEDGMNEARRDIAVMTALKKRKLYTQNLVDITGINPGCLWRTLRGLEGDGLVSREVTTGRKTARWVLVENPA